MDAETIVEIILAIILYLALGIAAFLWLFSQL